MRIGVTTLACIASACAALGTTAFARAEQPSGSPYQGIVDRNVFALRPPPPPPSPEDNKPPPPKITLQGITTMRGNKLALMKVLVPGGRPGTKTEEVPLILAVGQASENVEVLEIDEKEGMVKVKDFGTVTNLTFKENGVNLASAAPHGPAPPGAPGGVPPPPGRPAYTPGYHPGPGGYERPSFRTQRMNSAGGSAYNPATPPPAVYTAAPANPVTPTYGTPTTSPGTVALNNLGAPASTIQPSKNWPPETPMTPEQAAIMEAAYTLKYQKEIQAGSMPSIPGSNPILDSGQQPQSGF